MTKPLDREKVIEFINSKSFYGRLKLNQGEVESIFIFRNELTDEIESGRLDYGPNKVPEDVQ